MNTEQILKADILDILFDNRNKTYGAYTLRKEYNQRILISILSVIGILVLINIISFISNSIKLPEKQKIEVKDVILEDVSKKEEKKPDIPPPPPPKAAEPPKVEITKFTPPKIVKDEEVKETPPEVTKVEESKIGTINVEGQKDEGIVAPIVETKGTGTGEAPKVEEDYDKLFLSVEIQAEFPGGKAEWQKYLQKYLNASVPADNGAPAGNYSVVISFIVDKTGKISEVTAENDPGYGTKEEAIRIIKKGPNWSPAIQNGHKVTYRARQTITFQVKDE